MDHSTIDKDAGNPDENQVHKRISKWRIACDCLQKRYLLAILGFLGFINVNAMRVSLNVALVAMVSNKTIYTASGDVEVVEPAEFNWTTRDQGIILSSFFYGYLITQIPGGYLATRFGGKNLLGGAILITALLTLLTPLAARGNMYLLIAIRVLEGFVNGVTFPSMHAIWSKWAPPMERSRLFSISYSGVFVGTISGTVLSGLIAYSYGWPAIFYFFGAVAVIWSALWFWLVTDSPFDHPTITDNELKYLEAEIAEDHAEKKVHNIPWKEIVTSIPFWAIVVAHITENWGYYTLLISLPTYLKKVFHLDLKNTGFFSALPYLVMMITVLAGGRLADYLRLHKILSTTAVRKISNGVGIILSSSFYGYMIAQIPGGYLAARYGGKNIFGGGVLITALLTLLTPLAARGSMYLLIAIRVLDGFFKGLTIPCRHAIWIKWAPPMERSKLASITSSGLIAGIVFGMVFSGLIADSFGWPAVFYFFGVMAIIWSALWFWLVTDSPFDHSTITDKELNYLKTELAEDHTEKQVGNVPWKKIAMSIPMWAIIVAHFTESWGYYTFLTLLPTYLKKVFHFDLKKTGFLSALPYLVMMVVVLTGGRLADLLRTRKILSTTAVRKIFNSLGFLFGGLFLLLVGYAPNKDIAVLELTLAIGFIGLSRSGFMVNHLDIAPRYAGLLYGITNCLGTIPGILSPPIVGIITKNEMKEEWRYVFIISSVMYLFGLVFFLIFSSGEKQPWAQPNKKEENALLNENIGLASDTSPSTATSV